MSCLSIYTSFSIRQHTARNRSTSQWRTRTTNDTLAEERPPLARIRGIIPRRTRLNPSTATCPCRKPWGTTRTMYFNATPRDIPSRPPPSPLTPRFTWPATGRFTQSVQRRRRPLGTQIRFGGRLSYEGGYHSVILMPADYNFELWLKFATKPSSTTRHLDQSIQVKASGKSIKRWGTCSEDVHASFWKKALVKSMEETSGGVVLSAWKANALPCDERRYRRATTTAFQPLIWDGKRPREEVVDNSILVKMLIKGTW